MQKNILITYASKAGSTAEVAAKVAETISMHNIQVSLLPIAEVKEISRYDAVVVGSAIRAGHLLPEVVSFVKNNQAELKQKIFSIFIVCLTMMKEDEDSKKIVSNYLNEVRTLTTPLCEGMFAGVMDTDKLNIVERLLMKAMKTPKGDFRKWEKISEWVETQLYPNLV